MNVLFVYSLDDIQSIQKPLRSWTDIQFGISYISSILKAHGHRTRLAVLGNNKWEQSKGLLQPVIEEFSPQVICFTAVFSQYPFIYKIADYIRSRWPDKYLVIGGVHATLNPDAVINGPFNALCVGEGEYPILELCSQLNDDRLPQGIANLWIKSSAGNIERNKTRDFLRDLDLLPFPDRDMWIPWMHEQLDAEFSMLLGRGCPHICTYCSNHVLKKIAGGKYVRMRSPENIIKEVDFIRNQYNSSNIYFEVESIALNKNWTFELCAELERYNNKTGKSISYGCNFRITPHSVDEKLFTAFEKANLKKINIGLESGSERIRREVLKREYSNDDFVNTISMARNHGLKISIYNMIGVPGETLSDHMETVRLNRLCLPDSHSTSIFFPYPGTELYETCIREGLLKGSLDMEMERRKAYLELPGFSKKQINKAFIWFDYRVYKGHKPLWVILAHVIAVKLRSNPTTNYIFRSIVQLPLLRNLRALLARR